MARTGAGLAALLTVTALAAAAVAAEAGKDSATGNQVLTFTVRSRDLVRDDQGHNVWKVETKSRQVKAAETALVLCDVWDKHWCRGANERLARLLPRMNEVVKTLRDRGVLIVHAPSDTMKFYEGSPARQRVLDAPKVEPPKDIKHEDPRLPIDASDQGADTEGKPHRAWSRQHPAIEIDQARDAVSDNGRDLYNLYRQRGIKNIVIMGVHTNMCVLGRSFAIKQMVRWGFDVTLVRDLTDTMYNPARPPYVSHDEGTRLVVEYIEAFWCPTTTSDDLLRGAAKE
ncbi:MAG TPA: isochorismatase family protein [Phycisphaerae bacterium]|nr:isochorismatase family protein [Phycisphaerae bacterium]